MRALCFRITLKIAACLAINGLCVTTFAAGNMSDVFSMPKTSEASNSAFKDPAKPGNSSLNSNFGKSADAINSGTAVKPPSVQTLKIEMKDDREAADLQSVVSAAPVDSSRSDFDRWVEKTAGRRLPIYGATLFSNANASFSVPEAHNVPSDYTIGVGDSLNVRTSGQLDLNLDLVVDRQGAIYLPTAGRLQVVGVRLDNLSSHVRSALARYYKGFDVNVTLGPLRGVRVYVTGFGQTPGTHVVSPLSTVISTIFATGGPAQAGSVRNIELRRGGQLIKVIDLYSFLMGGDKSSDTRIQTGDIIHYPASTGMAAVAGSVNTQAIYQISPYTTLGQLLKYAGGVSVLGNEQRIVLERIGNNGSRETETFPLNDTTRNRPIRNGDLVLVSFASPTAGNAVTLRGNVAQPVRYPWRYGMRISDLIPNQSALIAPSYWQARRKTIPLDLLQAPSADDTSVKLSFPEINWDYAVVERIDPLTLKAEIIPFNLGDVVLRQVEKDNILLSPGDIVTIFSQTDFRQPQKVLTKFVRVEGEVQRPGIYPAEPGDTIQHLITKAGGITAVAHIDGMELNRASLKKTQADRMRDVIDSMERDFNSHSIARAQNVTQTEETNSLGAEMQSIQMMIARMRKVEPTGRVIINMPKRYLNPATLGEIPSIVLEHNDAIYIPKISDSVFVLGAVNTESAFVYNPGIAVQDYLRQAGGLRPSADSSRIFIIHIDGTMDPYSSGPFGWFSNNSVQALGPGDTILVNEATDRVSWTKNIKDWTQIMYQFGLGAAGLKILRGN